jgi:hypothetical protein
MPVWRFTDDDGQVHFTVLPGSVDKKTSCAD